MEISSILTVANWLMKHIRRQKVLLAVEDNPDDVLLLREEMKAAKFRYKITRTAEEALGVLQTIHFDAAIIDIGLPMMSGEKLSKRIKDEHPKTKVFLITGSSFINLEEGQMLRIIRKPITAKVLREMVI